MTRPKRSCAEPGCPTLVTRGYCLRHNRNRELREGQGARAQQQRETMRKYDRRWRKLRKIVLARDPICMTCQEAPSTEVDHIIPRRPEQHAADVTEEELQGLCKPCHSSKTRVESAPKSVRRRKPREDTDLAEVPQSLKNQ
ncbi:hypothetical protein LCGC14_2609460 [marine sediment metagenome]|uniref:HNH nuclease domain-containing protein n=1 Tax=marine sediment metagenome TaxID=412755 RepID=A0A0F9ATX4_9ZZZZ